MATSGASSSRVFEVRVSGVYSDNKPFNNRLSMHKTLDAALARATSVVSQWIAAKGNVRAGTGVSVVDMHDGGKVFEAKWLGMGQALLSEEQEKWPSVPTNVWLVTGKPA